LNQAVAHSVVATVILVPVPDITRQRTNSFKILAEVLLYAVSI
jgi:hypothetical protein